MTWEETIQFIRTKPEYKELVEKAYFEENLVLNIERFENGEEFKETLKILREYQPQANRILDIGCGNGISAISFAKLGYQVTAVEPDSSETIGAGAVRHLAKHFRLSNITIHEAFAEDIHFDDNIFDVVYIRQAMHHAYDLDKFIAEAGRVLKKGGLLFTVRDHVIFDEKDKAWFLEMHPLHMFYGGENAFTAEEYKGAMLKAGLKIEKEIKYYDNIINYFPSSRDDIESYQAKQQNKRKEILRAKIGSLSNSSVVLNLFNSFLNLKIGKIQPLSEKEIPGRMYSYLAIKK